MWTFEIGSPVFDIDKEAYTHTIVTVIDDLGQAIGSFRMSIEGLTRDQVISTAVAKLAAIKAGITPEMQSLGGLRFTERGDVVSMPMPKGNGHAGVRT